MLSALGKGAFSVGYVCRVFEHAHVHLCICLCGSLVCV
jgi:hypothetical protein